VADRIDVHSHVFPGAFLERLAEQPGDLRADREDDHWVVRYGDRQRFVIHPGQYDPTYKLNAMRGAGIGHALISPNIPGPDLLEGEASVEVAMLLNDAVADIVAGAPDRFSAFATLPWSRPDRALLELERVASLPGFRGVMLHSHIAGRPVDAPEFEPVFAAVAASGLPLVLHPTVPTWADAIRDHEMIPMLGLQVDCSFAMLRLVLSGTLERHPRLSVVMPHAGGVLPYMMGRIEHQTEVLGRGRAKLSKPPGAYFSQVFLDSVTPSPETLAFACRFAGPEHMLFGTDHPWVDMNLMVDVVAGLPLAPAQRDALTADNARVLFGLPVSPPWTASPDLRVAP
jgi:predicted TIM-barrel fold metal-dependent hydrolase